MKLQVLHLLHHYLPLRENWLFHLISNLPETTSFVGAGRFIRDDPLFFQPGLLLLRRPVKDFLVRKGLPESRLGWRLTRLVDRLYRFRLERYARRADVVHSHFADLGWSHHRWIRRLRKPHVISYYGYDYPFRPSGQGDADAALRALINAADLFLCEGGFGRQRLIGWGFPAEKVHVQHLGVDTSRIPIHPRRKLAGELNLVQAAGFVEKKGHQYTIAAFVEALAECPNMTLTLVGPNPIGLREKLIAQMPAPVRERVCFPDPIPASQIHEFLKDFQVFIHPSCHTAQGDSEGGAPVVLLDAQATGLPIISTRHCDIPEEVLDRKTGLLADEKDTTELARYIRRFYFMGQAEYDAFARAAVEHVRSEYDVRQTAAHLVGEYRDLLRKAEENVKREV